MVGTIGPHLTDFGHIPRGEFADAVRNVVEARCLQTVEGAAVEVLREPGVHPCESADGVHAEQRRFLVTATGDFDEAAERVAFVVAAAVFDAVGERREIRAGEQPLDGNVGAERVAQFTGDGDGGDGTATEIEESAVGGDLVDRQVEVAGEHRGDGLRDVSLRRHIRFVDGGVGGGQRRAVDLAGRHQRQRIDDVMLAGRR